MSVQSGNWSNPATWSLDHVPQAGDIVDINPGTTVTYDVDDTTDSTPLNTVKVENGATLTFSTTTSTQMYVVNLMVDQGGTLDIGTQANPIPAGVTAAVVWINQPLNTTTDPAAIWQRLDRSGHSEYLRRGQGALCDSGAERQCR